ncbi:MAG: serine/threonine-protein kinase [Polyangiales bacterium]
MSQETLPYDPHAPAPPSRPAGTQLGRYTLVRRIGCGGMGEVYEATHRDLDKRVALKLLRPEFAARPQVRARFAREGVAASKLRHPHVVDVSDFAAEGDDLFLVMELLEGESLEALLARGPVPPARIASVMLPVCAAVDAAHRAGIVHRDLKPANIFLARSPLGDEVVKVLDFGISKLTQVGAPDGLTASAATLGTSWYMSPEQVLGAHAVTPASDQFALGTMLYECVTGRRPFMGASLYLVMRAITAGEHEPLATAAPDAPPALVSLIERALSVSPDARFGSVAELARALLTVAAEPDRSRWAAVFSGPTTTPPPAPEPATVRSPSTILEVPMTRPRGAAAVALAAVAVLLSVAAFALRPRPQVRPAVPITPLAAPPQAPAPTEPITSPPPAPAAIPAAPALTPTPAPPPTAPRVMRPLRPRPAVAPARAVGANGAPIEE